MKLNLESVNLKTVVQIDVNTLEFQTQGEEEIVRISKRLDGWRVRFEVQIGNRLWHSDEATKDDAKSFQSLEQIAFENRNHTDEAKVKRASEIGRDLFTLAGS